MDYIEAAAQLGQALRTSEQFRELNEAESDTFTDSEAAKILVDYRAAQKEMAEAASGDVTKEDLEEIRSKLLAKQAELNSNKVIRRYLDAKKAFDQMMQEVNSVLSHYLEGGTSECSGSCETCGGCG